MTLSAERIQQALAPRAVRFYRQAGSTNDIALDWLRQGAPTGSVIIADEQLKGRGRMGRTWHTPPGVALAVSIVLHPPPDILQQVSMLGALAIAELAEQTGAADVGIKWPNDVQIGGRKVSGVLPEIAWEGEKLLGVVLGLGINVRTDFAGTELENTAVSLETVPGKPLDRLELLVYLLERVDYWNSRLSSPALFAAWKNRLTTIGRPVTISGAAGGIADGVDEEGALLVRDEHGAIGRIIAGDIALG